MQKIEIEDISLEEWEKEINEGLSFLEKIVEDEDTPEAEYENTDDLNSQLKRLFHEMEKSSGPEILEKINKLVAQDDETKIFLNILQNLVKATLKIDPIKKLGVQMTDYLSLFLESSNISEKKKVVDEIYKKYLDLTPKSKHNVTIKNDSHQIIINKITQVLESKLHEINIKIEENQRTLHQLALGSFNQGKNTESELVEGADEISGEFYVCKVGDNKFALPKESVLNIYKISPKKAKKLAQKSIIRFSQLGSLFSSITKGLKKELIEKNKKELSKLFLHVLDPLFATTDSNHTYNKAVLLKLPDKDKLGVIFVDSVYSDKPIRGEIIGNSVDTLDGEYQLFDIGKAWEKNRLKGEII
ncbi:hypothetical protein KFV02_07325 [Desulfohalobiaceae bacterium Ax17]|uniref:hypothetical protein n=1 Tax=Desulfovulcanus ferrireducens TaxID=2831190 RepID=UPI00207BC30F|nr:hypothetical protein [Desulfovulcanus ferrireducens]MBT8763741.1 hypothetical protein [Desulfovulcanus ferrireducens]